MHKQVYVSPELKELGNLRDLTQYAVDGEGFDAGYPDGVYGEFFLS